MKTVDEESSVSSPLQFTAILIFALSRSEKITTKCEHAGLELGISYFKENFPCNFEPLFVTVSDPNQLIDRKRYLQDNALLQRSLMTVQVQFEP